MNIKKCDFPVGQYVHDETIKRQPEFLPPAAYVRRAGMGIQLIGNLAAAHAADQLLIKDLLRLYKTVFTREKLRIRFDGQCFFHVLHPVAR